MSRKRESYDLDRLYSSEPVDGQAFTHRFNKTYGRFARLYDLAVKVLPHWRRWIGRAIPHLKGPRVLEVSCGTGWLLSQYAGIFESSAIDLNEPLLRTAHKNVLSAGLHPALQLARVEALPFPDGCFDTVLNTMAFSGYPDGRTALAEMKRVLRPGGRLVLVDINYPNDENWLGWQAIRLWGALGDIIRDMQSLLSEHGFRFTDQEIGGFGSVHLYVAMKEDNPPAGKFT